MAEASGWSAYPSRLISSSPGLTCDSAARVTTSGLRLLALISYGTREMTEGGRNDRGLRTHQEVRRQARRGRPELHRRARPGHRLPGPERRRQVDDDENDPRA